MSSFALSFINVMNKMPQSVKHYTRVFIEASVATRSRTHRLYVWLQDLKWLPNLFINYMSKYVDDSPSLVSNPTKSQGLQVLFDCREFTCILGPTYNEFGYNWLLRVSPATLYFEREFYSVPVTHS